tara:strand:+ start:369 stop:707 length:339 start_codon:yes stop_codon:yes gene_type:complete
MKIYHNPRCRKSRETLKIIKESGNEFEIINYLENIPSENELKEILTKLNIQAEDLLRREESIFKENFKGKILSENQWIEVMLKNPKLIERPIVVKGDKAILGRPPQNVKQLL